MARIERAIDGGGPVTPRTTTPTPKTPRVSTVDQLAAKRAQEEAAKALAQARANATTLAAQLGATVDTATGKIDTATINPQAAATWYASQQKAGVPTGPGATGPTGGGRKVVSNYTDPQTGDVINVYDDSSEVVVRKGTKQLDAARAKSEADAAAMSQRKSAYDLLYQQFAQYGLQSLVAPLEGLIKEAIPPSEFTIRLRDTDAYKKRFAANAQRIAKGYRALSEADYIAQEDLYQDVMRKYGMPASYYQRGEMGRQESFEKLMANNIREDELADRLSLGYDQVINANPEVYQAIKDFNITNGDILAYVLDPERAIGEIKRKVTMAEIGAGAIQAGLSTTAARAEELQRLGVTKAAAREGFQNVAAILPRASQLGDIYAKQGMGPFTQTTAEAEVFGTQGATEAAQKRRKLSELETAQFSGQTGVGALGRERAGQF